MTEASFQREQLPAAPGLKDWLFDPFRYLAGTRSLLLGLAVILLAGFVGSFSKTHFDGVLDLHTGKSVSTWIFLLEGIIDWLSLACILFIVGKITSRTAFRMIDLFGTQALARWPSLPMTLLALAPQYQRFTAFISQTFLRPGEHVPFPAADAIVFAIVMLLMLAMLVWMVALMYRSYSLCCNLKGWKGAISFIIGLFAAEVISKLALYWIIR